MSTPSDKSANTLVQFPCVPAELRRAARPPSKRPLRVTVSGCGPAGALCAVELCERMGDAVEVTVYEPRLSPWGAGFTWKGEHQGNRRRMQVVTLQANVWTEFPEPLREHLFVPGQYSEMWPVGPASPDRRRAPRNVPIRRIEDSALALAQHHYGVRIIPERFDPQRWTEGDADLLIIAEGTRSPTREHFREHFGPADPSLYLCNGRPFREMVLGIEVTSRLPDAQSVIQTVANNRFLLNTLHGRGFLNMRVCPEEAREVVAISRQGLRNCNQGFPGIVPRGQVEGEWPPVGGWFKPALDRYSLLWPRIVDGLRWFGVDEGDVAGVSAFELGTPEHRPRFVAELAPGRYGCLIGDAANAIHFWPGRGLNTGAMSALSLARGLARSWNGRGFIDAHFTRHEMMMHGLQWRNKTRAWRTVLQADEQGRARTIHDRIEAGLRGGQPRGVMIETMMRRMAGLRERLDGRMPGVMPTDAELRRRLEMVGDGTLGILVESGAWVTREVGGEEVGLDWLCDGE